MADTFKHGQPVIMNLQEVDRDLLRRLIDFASGLCYALNGKLDKVASGVYLLTPANVSDEDRRQMAERDFDCIFVAMLRCASPGSYSLRSAMPRASLRCAGRAGRTGPARSAALRPAPTRFARQCLGRRCGAPAEPDAPGWRSRLAGLPLRSAMPQGAPCCGSLRSRRG